MNIEAFLEAARKVPTRNPRQVTVSLESLNKQKNNPTRHLWYAEVRVIENGEAKKVAGAAGRTTYAAMDRALELWQQHA